VRFRNNLRNDMNVLRARINETEARTSMPRSGPTAGNPAMLCQVMTGGNMPTAVPRYFLTKPCSIHFKEREGAPITFKPLGGKSVVGVLGPEAPQIGDYLIAGLKGGRWTAGYGGKPPTDCSCTCVPKSLSFTSDGGPQFVLDDDGNVIFSPGNPFLLQGPFSIQFNWGPPPGGNRWYMRPVHFEGTCVGYPGYLQLPDMGWFAEPFEIGTTSGDPLSGVPGGMPIMQYFYFYVSGCAAYIISAQGGLTPGSDELTGPFGDCHAGCFVEYGTPVINANLGAGGTVGGVGGSAVAGLFAEGPDDIKNTCDPFRLRYWSWSGLDSNGGFTTVSGSTLEVKAADGDYTSDDCVELDETKSAGVPQGFVLCPESWE